MYTHVSKCKNDKVKGERSMSLFFNKMSGSWCPSSLLIPGPGPSTSHSGHEAHMSSSPWSWCLEKDMQQEPMSTYWTSAWVKERMAGWANVWINREVSEPRTRDLHMMKLSLAGITEAPSTGLSMWAQGTSPVLLALSPFT
jgi:hypothetical protein